MPREVFLWAGSWGRLWEYRSVRHWENPEGAQEIMNKEFPVSGEVEDRCIHMELEAWALEADEREKEKLLFEEIFAMDRRGAVP